MIKTMHGKNYPYFLKSLSLIFIACFLSCQGAVKTNFSLPDVSRSNFKVSGWLVYWDFEESLASLENNLDIFDTVYLFNYAFDEDGHLIENEPLTEEQQKFLASLRQKNIKVIATLVNDVIDSQDGSAILKDPQMVHQLLSESSQRDELLNNIAYLMEEKNLDGVDIDFENLWYTDRDIFSSFIEELSRRLHANNKFLSVTVQPKRREETTDGAGAVDWSQISLYADQIQVMCYNFSSPSSPPGPIAPPSWIEEIISFAQTQIPSAKLTAAIGLHGFDWAKDKTQSLTYAQAVSKAAQNNSTILRDTETAAPYFRYSLDFVDHEVWFEDKTSLASQMKILKKYQIKNLVLWRLGEEDPEIYPFLKSFKKKYSLKKIQAHGTNN